MKIPGNDAAHMQTTGRYALLNKDFFVDLEKIEIETLSATELMEFARVLFIEDRMALSAIGVSSEELAMLL
ncbi:hypothetical protein D3C87_2061230 [compost metagenome]